MPALSDHHAVLPFRALLREAWGLDDGDPAATEAALTELVRTRAPDLEPWLALIGTPLGPRAARVAQVAELDDQFRPVRTHSAVSALLRASNDRPTMFLIDGTQWMDEASRDLLNTLIAEIEPLPWLIILSRQPGDDGFVATENPHVRRIDLPPLDPDHARVLLQQATTGVPLLSSQVDTLAARAEGNPLFLLELLHALRAGAAVDYLPQSVEGLIAAGSIRSRPPTATSSGGWPCWAPRIPAEHTPAVLGRSAEDPGWLAKTLGRLGDFLSVETGAGCGSSTA